MTTRRVESRFGWIWNLPGRPAFKPEMCVLPWSSAGGASVARRLSALRDPGHTHGRGRIRLYIERKRCARCPWLSPSPRAHQTFPDLACVAVSIFYSHDPPSHFVCNKTFILDPAEPRPCSTRAGSPYSASSVASPEARTPPWRRVALASEAGPQSCGAALC